MDEAPITGRRRYGPAPARQAGRPRRTARAADGPSATSPPVPRQLPPAAHGFVGRAGHLAELTCFLDGHLDQAGAGQDSTGRDGTGPVGTAVLAVVGPAGVGKTALAVHWAHQVQERFPDGQLYVNLRGCDYERPMTPEQALD
ncbi:MAG TPA: hypothetical protein VFM54_13230, partial [Micromonosporaceae bacterium]|nr:hypothetical protein [Micromonosporaceae bacterium]